MQHQWKIMSIRTACDQLNAEGHHPPVRPGDFHHAVKLGHVSRPLELGGRLWLVDAKHLAEMRKYLALGIRRGPRKKTQIS